METTIPDLRSMIFYLKEQGITQYDLADIIGLPQSGISGFVSGKIQRINFDAGYKLMKYYEKVKEEQEVMENRKEVSGSLKILP